ncbi:diphthamide synthase KNAG_0M00550 [Huiozyma naganishii CBS 8797]|uniref:methylated diphthine methylhydrolase n=1 Tax=Huiozyma naganishii (strain ATCC MYA-139 / BCRC 22969 / CBS 8797 / KCTC 17520 / NBRC 10181 / NCYC 3082 / Yp74L-3) TaxID=1071383 RepID=J7RSL2_HUIN7|nr:hypothetical protein KNAG_0M00550 [Kazachstania naganishii CBS 8797]CCK72908.1 hypothetical protein KNAG_0M00550 [Kazachstania naganishii CBS 8797]
MEESTVLHRSNTKFPPCCLKIFHDKYVLVGTYRLHKDSTRTGSLDVFDDHLNLLLSIPTYGAILDLKLSPFDSTLMVTAHSTGNISLWNISLDGPDILVKQAANIQLFDVEALISSVHFSPLNSRLICITTTMGEVATVNIEVGEEIEAITSPMIADYYSRIDQKLFQVQGEEINAIEGSVMQKFDSEHQLECWTAEFGQLSPLENVIFSGGDDAAIMGHDLRSGETIWSNSRIHEAGVVGIKCATPNFRTNKPTSILTGSYDDHIRCLDLRMLGESLYPGHNVAPAQVSSCNLNGGVWRFSELPVPLNETNTNGPNSTLLVCCMYDGAKIVTYNDALSQFEVSHFLKKGHESMCYGGDWCSNFIGTCSFYDKAVQLWNP